MHNSKRKGESQRELFHQSRCKLMRIQIIILPIWLDVKFSLLRCYAGKKICKTAEKELSER